MQAVVQTLRIGAPIIGIHIGSAARCLGRCERHRAILVGKLVLVTEGNPTAVPVLLSGQKIAVFICRFYIAAVAAIFPARRLIRPMGSQQGDGFNHRGSHADFFALTVSDLTLYTSYPKIPVFVKNDELVTNSFQSISAHMEFSSG